MHKAVMTIDPSYCDEWGHPALLLRFYVWQYATSMAGAAGIRGRHRA